MKPVVEFQGLILFAIGAIWLAISYPIYRLTVLSASRHGVHVGPLNHLAWFAAALLVPPLLVGFCMGIGCVIDWTRGATGRWHDHDKDR